MTLTIPDARDALNVLVGELRASDGTGAAGVHTAITLVHYTRGELAAILGVAVMHLAGQPEAADIPAAPDVTLDTSPPEAFPTFTAEQIVAIDHLATTCHGHTWRIDLWTDHGVLHATPTSPTKETDQ